MKGGFDNRQTYGQMDICYCGVAFAPYEGILDIVPTGGDGVKKNFNVPT